MPAEGAERTDGSKKPGARRRDKRGRERGTEGRPSRVVLHRGGGRGEGTRDLACTLASLLPCMAPGSWCWRSDPTPTRDRPARLGDGVGSPGTTRAATRRAVDKPGFEREKRACLVLWLTEGARSKRPGDYRGSRRTNRHAPRRTTPRDVSTAARAGASGPCRDVKSGSLASSACAQDRAAS